MEHKLLAPFSFDLQTDLIPIKISAFARWAQFHVKRNCMLSCVIKFLLGIFRKNDLHYSSLKISSIGIPPRFPAR